MDGEKERLGDFTFRPSTEFVNEVVVSLKMEYKQPVGGMRWYPFVTSWLLPGDVDDITLAKLMVAQILLDSLGTVWMQERMFAGEKNPRPTELRIPVTLKGKFRGYLGQNPSPFSGGPTAWVMERVEPQEADRITAILVEEFNCWVKNGCGGKNPFGFDFRDSAGNSSAECCSLVMNADNNGVDMVITNPDYAADEPDLEPLPPLDPP